MLNWCNGNTFGYIHRKFVGSSPIFNAKALLCVRGDESSFAAMIAACFAYFSRPAAVSYPVKIRDKADRRLTAWTDEQPSYKRILNMKIQDMAMSRRQAMNRAMDLAPRFVEHFDKIYNNKLTIDANHWASEMQAWLNQILGIKLKETKKQLSLQEKMDWFFTNGSDSETLFKDQREAMIYDDFIDLVAVNNDVKKSLNEIGLL